MKKKIHAVLKIICSRAPNKVKAARGLKTPDLDRIKYQMQLPSDKYIGTYPTAII